MTTKIYADNEKLYPAMCKWKQQIRETGDRKMPDELGIAIMDIAHGLARRYNFNRYSEDWKMDMIDDGISATISGLHNFDETKYTNVYGYINKACWQAFVTRILYEKKENAKKYKYFLEHVYDSDDADMTSIADETFIQDIHDKLNQYEESAKKPKDKIEVVDESPTLEMFL